VWNSVPALLDMALVVGADWPGWAQTLRAVLVSGDWVGLDLSGRLAGQGPGAVLYALGGATEAAIWSNVCRVPVVVPAGWRSVPYGRPLTNQMFRVVDGRGRDCPDWVAGELWIGGAGVARGYRHDPQRTAAQFVDGWYRTGDLGRYWPDGTLEFLGRRDFQVKIRGHRIELGEVEAALAAYPGVVAAVALAAGTAARRLVAAVSGEVDDVADVRSFVADRLPGYMVPEQVVLVDRMPLSGNGKIDRGALARQLTDATTGEDEALDPPRTPTETLLATVWADLLHTPTISRHHNFFALGGDSLLATQLVQTVRKEYTVGLSLRQLLDAPTVAELAALVDSELAAQDPDMIEEGVV
jgi:acyl carrier protein